MTTILATLVASTKQSFASAIHEDWRKGFDSVYAETGVVSKNRVKPNDDGTTGDINVPFNQLNITWQRENLAAADAAFKAQIFSSLEDAAAFVHMEWMKRNPKQDYNTHQHVDYDLLPEDEKQKDRDHVINMKKLLVS